MLDRLQRGEPIPNLRHLLESAVLQANTAFEDDDGEPDDERSEADEQMTDAFRAFGER